MAMHAGESQVISQRQHHYTAKIRNQRRGARGRDQAKSDCCRSSSRNARWRSA
ncbi:hypothetical protein HLX93_27315 [Escherichia coli]|nr:hypothetical protein [Escherichia coli]